MLLRITLSASLSAGRPAHIPSLAHPEAGIDATVAEVLRLPEEEWSCTSNLPPSEGLPVHTIVGHRLTNVDPGALRGFLSIRTSLLKYGVHFNRHLGNSGP